MELFNENSKLASVIHKDHSLLPVINRLGVKLGFGDKTIRNICEEREIDLNFFVEIINVFHYEAYFHIDFEESVMFPYVLELNQVIENPLSRPNFRQKYPDFSISGFEKEHSAMDDKMDDLKNIIIKYLPPNYDQNRGNAFLSNLFMFEKDLKNHSRIEDHILLPKVKQLEMILQSHE